MITSVRLHNETHKTNFTQKKQKNEKLKTEKKKLIKTNHGKIINKGVEIHATRYAWLKLNIPDLNFYPAHYLPLIFQIEKNWR
jgi:hypothetical protein